VPRLISVTAVALVLQASLAISEVQAAGPAFCRHYAKEAVRQVRGALALHNCQGTMEGSRWSVAYEVHFDSCRKASLTEAEQERDARVMYLRQCRR
jgi:hypothetical protein